MTWASGFKTTNANERQGLVYTLLAVYGIALMLGILCFKGTGDMGDSIAHYLFARYAPAHPELYFHHWAKPLFVLLASPFAQAGLEGVKTMNAMLTLATIWFTYRSAVKLQLPNAWVLVVLMMGMPLYYILTLSALTEPMFAFFIALSLHAVVDKKFVLAAVLLSFLPFVRSEGLIVIGSFLGYFIWIKQWKALPFLLTGSVVYTLAGYMVHKDVLWVFTKIPYATLSSVYGSGTWFHFIEQLVNVTGVPVYILFWIGFIASIVHIIKRGIQVEVHVIVFLGFSCFFAAHSLFWYLGIFNSMGLKRVLVGIAPYLGIISLVGFNTLSEPIKQRPSLHRILYVGILFYIVLFPITPNPSAIVWEKDLMKLKEQQTTESVAAEIKKVANKTLPLCYNHYYLSVLMENDRFDPGQRTPLSKKAVAALPKGSVIVWDNKLMWSETDVTREELNADTTLVPLTYKESAQFGKRMEFAVYRKK